MKSYKMALVPGFFHLALLFLRFINVVAWMGGSFCGVISVLQIYELFILSPVFGNMGGYQSSAIMN